MACAVALWVYNEMPKLSTVQVAKLLGMHQPNFQRAIKRGTIPAPPLANVGGITMRLWSPKDVRRAIEALKKSKTWKRPRRKPEGARSAQGARKVKCDMGNKELDTLSRNYSTDPP